jgi:light-regulated signal transduction histidine kinase (bacteriophytochrome)
MNSLLKRQIRKYLSEELKKDQTLSIFLDAVDKSYDNFDEQSSMIQRAMSISSDELFYANRQLQKEADEQKELIDKLKNVINTLKFYELKEDKQANNIELSGAKLVDFIDNQTKEIVEINKQKEALLSELAHQNQELNDYAHMVSHDLKSPLRSIDSLTAWLKEDYSDKFDDKGKQQLALIRNSVEKMDVLISGILEYSTIGRNKIEVYDIDLNKLIDGLLKTIQIPAYFSIIKNELPVIKGDKYRVKQLFQNLIVNASSYNDKTAGKLEIGAKDLGAFWEFSIKDNGMGIEEVYFDKIFKTFEFLDSSVKSSGIGLSIVKKIVDLYGGKIWLTSKLHVGTTFFFTLKKQPNGTT